MTKSKGYIGIGMNGLIATLYDKDAKRYSMGLYREWAKRLALQIRDGADVLEIAPGPAYLAIELAKLKRCRIVTLEISRKFIAIARKNIQGAGVAIDSRWGNASAMLFEDATFDFVVCTSSFKNFSEPIHALREIYRVLKPEGQAWISDLRRDVSDQAIQDFVAAEMKMKGMAAGFMRYTFKHILRPRAYSAEQFSEMAEKIPFGKVQVKNNLVDFEALLEK